MEFFVIICIPSVANNGMNLTKDVFCVHYHVDIEDCGTLTIGLLHVEGFMYVEFRVANHSRLGILR